MPWIGLRDVEDPDAGTPAPDEPPSPRSYWFPLFVIVLLCAGYLAWRRRSSRGAHLLGLRSYPNGPAGVRLSMDDDGPAATSFIMNNGSNESLPSHALSDLPVLPDHPSPDPTSAASLHPAYQDRASSSVGSYTSTPDVTGMPSTGLSRTGSSSRMPGTNAAGGFPFPTAQSGGSTSGSRDLAGAARVLGGGRRSARIRGPIEGGDESQSEVEVGESGADVFGIGDDEDEPPSKGRGPL